MGRHSAGECYADPAPPVAARQLPPVAARQLPPVAARQLGSRQPPSRAARWRVLPVFGGVAVLALAAGTAVVVLGGGKVSAGPAGRPAAHPAASAAARPVSAVAGSPVVIGFAGVAQVVPSGRAAAPRRRSARVTPRPAAAPAAKAPATQAPSLVSTLQDLPVNTLLTGSQAVAWAQAALAALGAPATSANVQTMLDWFNNEGTPHDYNNPLNLNVAYGGSTISTADGDPPAVHIQAYPAPADFVRAFAIQIGDNPSYPAITASLRSGAGLEGSAATPQIASELEVYSGGGYDSIPGAPS